MSWKQIGLWCVLGDFAALTLWAIVSEGYTAFVPATWAFASASLWGAQVTIDFLLAIGVALSWIVADARERGVAAWPFVAGTLTLGSIGLLAYMIHRERSRAPATLGAPAQALA